MTAAPVAAAAWRRGPASLPADDPLWLGVSILVSWNAWNTGDMEPLERLREAGKRVTDPLEATAQRVALRAIDLVIHAVDINEFVAQIDLNAVLDRIDITRLLERVDLNTLLEHVDLNALIQRVDVEALVSHTDFGEIIAKQTSGIASGALDAVREQAVSMDGSIDRGVWRLVRRNAARPEAPALLRGPAES
jgi:hypothetical protein